MAGERALAIFALLLTAGCTGTRGPKRAPPIGEAFVAPPTLNVRADFAAKSATVATVHHGDRVAILQRHRRVFIRVRTASGAEGWVDEKQLLSASDMDKLKDLAKRAAKLPVQAQATADRNLNVYMAPSTQAPVFLQLKEKDKVDLLGLLRAPRVEIKRDPLIPPAPKKAKAPAKPAKEPKYPPPPMPKPPGPPKDWLELSKSAPPEESEEPEEAPARPVPVDDWSLVRTPTGQTGWALRRFLTMAIPDEVAQYAEGRRIVAYFPLGEVRDGDLKKNIWLWATVGGHPEWDFESFRVFIWSLRHHRYETAYIERNVEGYLPVLLETTEYSGAKYPGFSVCVERSDGHRYRRSFALLGNIVRYAGDRPCEPPPSLADLAKAPEAPVPNAAASEQPKESFTDRMKKRLKTIFKR